MTHGFGLARTVLIGVLFLFSSCMVLAQVSRTGATLEGTVRDSSGAVVPHATLKISNDLTNQARFATTDQQGFFRATQLSIGTYDVYLTQRGFAPYQRKGITLSLGETTELPIALSPPSAAEQVTVTAQTSGMDTSQTSVVSSIDQERIEELPVHPKLS